MVGQADDILAQIKQKQASQVRKKGSLKIFFGYAAGVGKTFAMLQEAQELKKLGVDIVIGYLEPHDRPETQELAAGLEEIPVRKSMHHGIRISEFDLNTALERKPEVILVDELAHTNAKDCVHEKRYQDVEELLENGIDVFTTVNIQHLESLNNVIENLLNVKVQETIPDAIFDQATQVKLVDIEPKDLIMRLKNGKIYHKVQALRALNNFFKDDNLAYLRELALRKMTMRLASHQQVSERLLVCISGAPNNQRVIRSAAQLADAFSCELIGLYISDDVNAPLEPQLVANIHLAESLGAKVVTLYGLQRSQLIADYAKKRDISKIILGAPLFRGIGRLFNDDLVEQLNNLVPEIDKYVISQYVLPNQRKKWLKLTLEKYLDISDLFKMLVILGVSSMLGYLFLMFHFSDANIILVYILGAMITALLTKGKRYSLIYSFIMVCLYDYLFTAPYISLKSNPDNIATFIIMFGIAFLSSSWTSKIRSQVQLETKRSYRTEILLKTSRTLQQAQKLTDVYQITGQQLHELLNCTVCIYPNKDNQLGPVQIFSKFSDNQVLATLTEAEKAVAIWSLQKQKQAGYKTNTLSKAKYMYLPLGRIDTKKAAGVVVLGLRENELPDPFTLNIVQSICEETKQAILRITTLKQQVQSELKIKQEKLRADLLRGISHDLRTPLTTVCGNADMLLNEASQLSEEKKHDLYQAILNDANWLINLVENLLAMTKVDSAVGVKFAPELVEDLFQAALEHIGEASKDHKIEIQLDDPALMVNADGQLISQVLVNIINNGLKYTPKGSLIRLSATEKADEVEIKVYNNGPQIESTKIFELFYTGQKNYEGRKGLGIGLALCRSIVEACGGQIGVKNVEPCGVEFYFTLSKWPMQDDGEVNE